MILSNYKEKRLQNLMELDYISFIGCGSKLNNDYISIISQ